MRKTRKPSNVRNDVDLRALDIDFLRFLKRDKKLEDAAVPIAPPAEGESSSEPRPASVGDTDTSRPGSSGSGADSSNSRRQAATNHELSRQWIVGTFALSVLLVAGIVLAATRIEPLNRALNATITEVGLSGSGETIPLRDLSAE